MTRTLSLVALVVAILSSSTSRAQLWLAAAFVLAVLSLADALRSPGAIAHWWAERVDEQRELEP